MDSPGSISVPHVGHHRWSAPPRRRRRGLNGRFNRTARVLLHEMRWRPPPPEYGLRFTAVTGSILLHIAVLLGFLLMRPGNYEMPASSPDQDVIEARLIDKEPPPPPPPPPPRLRHLKQHKKNPAQTRAVTTVSPPVTTVPPVEVQKLPPPVVSLQQPKPEVATPPGVPQPPQRVQASPPLPEVPTPAAPPPPKIILEKSQMALQAPPIQVEQVQPSTIPSSILQPVPSPTPVVTDQIGAPKSDITIEQALPASPQPVERPQELPPTPQVAEVPLPSAEPPDVKLDSAPPPPAMPLAAPQPEPLQRPELQSTPPPAQIAAQPATTPAEQAQQAAPQPAQTPSVEAPSQSVANAAPSSEAPSTEAATAPSDWSAGNDQFSPQASSANGHAAPVHGHGKGAHGGGNGKPGNYVQLYPRGNSDVMGRSGDRLGYQPTIFDKYWAPDNEDAITSWLRHIVDALTFKHTFDLGRGVRVHCVLGPMAVFFGCGGDPPPPPSVRSGDPRLNMAPSAALVPGLGPASGSTVSKPPQSTREDVQCATARVTGGPPPPGCPGAPVQPSKSDQWH